MKTINLIIGHVLVLNLLISIAFVFSGENEHALMEEKICGCWINKDYDQNEKHARWDINPDGTFACYSNLSSESPCWKGSYMISKKWTDIEGKVWFDSIQEVLDLIESLSKSRRFVVVFDEFQDILKIKAADEATVF